MGNILVGVIILAAALNAVRMVHQQKKRMQDWKCMGDCNACKTPCQAKRVYHKTAPGSK